MVKKNENGEWTAYNREYMPLGFNKDVLHDDFKNLPIYTKYKKISNTKLFDIVGEERYVQRDSKGDIVSIHLYNDGTNPINVREKKDPQLWANYFEKLQKLSKLFKR